MKKPVKAGKSIKPRRMFLYRALITVLLVVSVQFLGARTLTRPDTSHCLEVEGKVLNADENHTGCTVRLYLDEQLVDSVVLKSSRKKFSFLLKKNRHYSIKVVKEGFQPKIVCVHTEISEIELELYSFYFETNLVSLEVLPAAVAAAGTVLPVAKIYFDVKRHTFYYSRMSANTNKKDLCTRTI